MSGDTTRSDAPGDVAPGGRSQHAEVRRIGVTEERITLGEHEEWVSHRAAGAIVGFCGVVRDHDGGRGVLWLHYTAHPSAQDVVTRIAEEVSERVAGVRALAVSHRVGDLEIGNEALVAAVSADHRAAAFEACAALVEEVKERLPVWKRQFFTDGTDEWVGCA